MPENKQFITTVKLLFAIMCCLGAVLFLRGLDNGVQDIPPAALPVKQGLDEALRRFENLGPTERSTLKSSLDKSNGSKVELVFAGMRDSQLIGELLTILAENSTDATFYVTGTETAGYSLSLSQIVGSGYQVGIAYYGNDAIAGKAAARQAISDFVRTGASIQLLTGMQPSTVLSLIAPDDDLLAAAYASSLDTVMVPSRTLHLSAVSSLPGAQELLDALPRGAILCLQLEGMTPDGVEYVRQLCAALAGTDFSKLTSTLLSSMHEPVREQVRVYTTQRAAAFTFTGLGNQEELDGVLSALELVKAEATFFVSADELEQYPSQVRSVLAGGHALGIAARSAESSGEEALLAELIQVQETLAGEYGYTGPLPVRPAFGAYTDSLRRACSAGGFTLLSALSNAFNPEDARETDPLAVLERRFPQSSGALQRGEIVHFQMKQYLHSSSLLGALVKLIAQQRNIYELKPVIDLLGNNAYTYTYPLDKESILPEVRDLIYPGQLKGDPFEFIQSRYTGIFWVNTAAKLPGFSKDEISKLDKKGLIPNNQNMVFLTFDDWGTDSTITALLDVLKKHKAYATFFVRTQHVSGNPNLLRAIALDGHSIASHTHNHFVLANDTGTGTEFTDLSPAQVQELTRDLVTSYQVLQSIAGDISVDERPALTRLFRPPTLSVGKSGLTAVFDCGFTHSISGSTTLNDYKATDAAMLAGTLKESTKTGAVLVMHMSDNSIYTAQALDAYLSEMAAPATGKAFRFVSLGELLN